LNDIKTRGIETRQFFWPLHVQNALKGASKSKIKSPVSENIGKNGIYLPMGKNITRKKQVFIFKQLLNSLNNFN
tara:strand:+ start:173 stop:394 length:222 start_codon:yes stop_codon:yes gene_type:complete